MAFNLLKFNPQTARLPSRQAHLHRVRPTLRCSSTRPPSSREDAVLQAQTSLAHSLQKAPLLQRPAARRPKQLRLRVEVPLADADSPAPFSQLALDIFGGIPRRTLLLWPDSVALPDSTRTSGLQHAPLSSAREGTFVSCDMGVFVAPDAAQLRLVRAAADAAGGRPMVLFNPGWGADEELEFAAGVREFVGSFAAVYALEGLEVKGVLRSRRGVVLKRSREEKWEVWMEGGGAGEMSVVSRFEERPSMAEVEAVLYNKMAVDSPLTKSVKFFKDMLSQVSLAIK